MRHLRHARDVDERLQLRLFVELDGALAEIDRDVTDALEVGRDLQAGRDEAQVLRRRLMEGEEADAEIVDIDVHAVHVVVALDRHTAEGIVALDETAHGVLDLLLDESAHLEDLQVQLFQLRVVVTVSVLARVHRRLLSRSGP